VSRRYLFDVNALIGLLWSVHSLHGKTNGWFSRETPQVLGCAFTELSFIRVSMADRTISASFEEAETALSTFIQEMGERYHFIDKLPPAKLLKGKVVQSHKQVSDHYLCEVAAIHHARLATLDSGIRHPLAELIG
jgi:predicted nucleic acid-binding protein